jgi:thiol-disulfide isomerase/thioredoxin
MSQKLIINTRITDDVAHVELVGVIDEDAVFDKIKNLQMNKFVFDFNKISMINSCGIREWIKYLQEIEGASIIYQNCPQIIIEQVNMVHGFIRKGIEVESFFAPYFCPNCDTEKKILLKNAEVLNFKAPTKQCNTCKSDLEFDAIEKQYFSFLGQGK